MPKNFSSTIKRVASAIPQSVKKKLENHMQCIFTDDEMTQNSVMEYLTQISKGDNANTRITYNGKEVPVISLPFEAVMFLKNNKVRSNYKYPPYHRESNKVPWAIWKEGTRTPPQSLRNNNRLFMTRTAGTLFRNSLRSRTEKAQSQIMCWAFFIQNEKCR